MAKNKVEDAAHERLFESKRGVAKDQGDNHKAHLKEAGTATSSGQTLGQKEQDLM